MEKEGFGKLAKREWYLQGFNGTPFLVSSCAASAFDLEPSLGDTFSIILYDFQEERADMFYPVDDLERLGAILRKRLAEHGFLEGIRKRYREECRQEMALMEQLLRRELSTMSDEELAEALAEANRLQRTSVGQGHIIEAFALTTDNILKERLSRYVQGKELNGALSLLTTPLEKSFVQERDEDLQAVKEAPAAEQEARITEHLERFHWVRNSYASGAPLTPAEITEELKSFTPPRSPDPEKIAAQQEALIKKLKLDKELQQLLQASRLISAFQDERKKNILIGVSHADALLEELSRRTGIEQRLLRYIDYDDDVPALLADPSLAHRLAERRAGLLQVMRPGGVTRHVGAAFHEWRRQRAAHESNEEVKEFGGLSASPGTAIGRVRICATHEAINRFQKGEVLVASMTRPEYLPAMKKAAAIITDEGGITSHAAIVSREMGKPCIIGTQVASRVLKDGDLVEVKANHGLIIILEQSGVKE